MTSFPPGVRLRLIFSTFVTVCLCVLVCVCVCVCVGWRNPRKRAARVWAGQEGSGKTQKIQVWVEVCSGEERCVHVCRWCDPVLNSHLLACVPDEELVTVQSLLKEARGTEAQLRVAKEKLEQQVAVLQIDHKTARQLAEEKYVQLKKTTSMLHNLEKRCQVCEKVLQVPHFICCPQGVFSFWVCVVSHSVCIRIYFPLSFYLPVSLHSSFCLSLSACLSVHLSASIYLSSLLSFCLSLSFSFSVSPAPSLSFRSLCSPAIIDCFAGLMNWIKNVTSWRKHCLAKPALVVSLKKD